MIDPRDEAAHSPGSGVRWEESWYFDFVSPDASLAGYVRLGLRPSEGRAWFWAAICGEGRNPVVVREHDVELPTPRSLEVRASGLWTDFICETPLEHWTIGVEAFGLALDDPADVFRGERGDRVAIGLDLEWEALGPAIEPEGAARYDQLCSVHGEILEGSTRVEFEGRGWRTHAWGRRDWWRDKWTWAGCHFEDGSFAAGATEDEGVAIESGVDPDGLIGRVELASNGRTSTATPIAHAPVFIPAPSDGLRSGGTAPGGVPAHLARALCRFTDAEGNTGLGWVESLTAAVATAAD